MKSIVLSLCMLLASASWAFSEDSALAANLIETVQSTLTGVVKDVSMADPTKGTKSEIVVKDAKGKVSHILVTSTTTLWDADSKAIMPDKIAAKSRVNVIYITSPEGIKIGKSIKVLK